MAASRTPSDCSGRFLGISALLHAALLLAAGIVWIQAPHTRVTAGKSSIEIELMAEAASTPAPTHAAPEPAAIPTPARAQKIERPHPTSVASNGARENQAHPDDLHNLPPPYPEAARLAHEQGLVMVEVEVTASGTPAEVRLSHSSGYPRLDQAALRAVRGWKFEPARLGGVPVSSRVLVPVKFQLQ